jgi:dTDP-4-amino-4,6-dideoxygalactose transaminase
METVPYLDLHAQYGALRAEILEALKEICDSTSFAQGPATADFEAKFAAYCGVDHCVSVNSGTSALHLALRCLDVGPGDEVVTVSMTFIATAWAISYVGATPVFVDIDPVRRTLNPDKLEAAITSRTKAIIPVHLYGMPADMDRIMAIAERHGLPVIEDAAQAHGARYRGRRVGEFGQIASFSFYPGKNLGAYGEGGALITNDASLARRARSLRDHAQRQKYLHDEIGYNYRMDSFQGAVLSIKLKYLDEWNTARMDCARH